MVPDAQAASVIFQRLSLLKSQHRVVTATCMAAFATRVRRPRAKIDSTQNEIKELKKKIELLELQAAQANYTQIPVSTGLIVTEDTSEVRDIPATSQQHKDALYNAKMGAITLFLKLNDKNNIFPRVNIVGNHLREDKIVSLVDYLEREGQKKFIKDFEVIQSAMKEGNLFTLTGYLRHYNVPAGEAQDLLRTIERERNSDKFWNQWVSVDIVGNIITHYACYNMGRNEGRREHEAESSSHPQVDEGVASGEASVPSLKSANVSSEESRKELKDTATTSVDDTKELIDTAKSITDSSGEELADGAEAAASGVAEASKGILDTVGDIFSSLFD